MNLFNFQIVNDVFALYMAGDIDLFGAEQILDYLDQETSPIVWDAALDGYQMLKEKEANRQFDRYLYQYWQVRYCIALLMLHFGFQRYINNSR